MQCPKCGYEIKWLTVIRLPKLSCPNCRTWLELAPTRTPFFMILLAMLPIQLSNLFRSYQIRPGPLAWTALSAGYVATWMVLIVLWIRESRRPRLKERERPKPEITLNLNLDASNSKGLH